MDRNWEAGIVDDHWLDPFYDFLIKTRKAKQIPVSILKKDLQRQMNFSPGNYDLFIIHDKDQIVCGGIGILLSERVYYKFLPDTNPDYLIDSPMVFLSGMMHARAKEKGAEIFDLGIAAAIGAPPNEGLATFKSRLGGKPSLKCRLRLSL